MIYVIKKVEKSTSWPIAATLTKEDAEVLARALGGIVYKVPLLANLETEGEDDERDE